MTHTLRQSKDRIGVLIVAPDAMTGELLKSAFAQARRNFAIETLTGSSRRVIAELGAHKPHVALVCDELQDGPQAGFAVIRKLRESHRHTATIMLLQSSKPDDVVGAFSQGARGVIHRTHSLKALSKCIQVVHKGQIWAGNEDLEHLLTALAHLKPLEFNDTEGMPLLTQREEQVVRLVANGLKNAEIAQKLKLKEHSIRNYLYRIFDKLGVSTRVELILYTFNQRERSN